MIPRELGYNTRTDEADEVLGLEIALIVDITTPELEREKEKSDLITLFSTDKNQPSRCIPLTY